MMNVMIIGGGGREHALAWKIKQSNQVDRVYVVPGNAGTGMEPGVENIDLDIGDFEVLCDFARNNEVGFTIVGPEAPLVAGIVDYFQAMGQPCFGPTKRAAQLEGSKTFTKDFLKRHNIPTAAYASFSNVESAVQYVREQALPLVIKADGLAAGKGVIIAGTLEEAESAVTDMLAGNRFGEAGHRVVIEEFMRGEEASFIVICDGKHALPLATSQDHKARDDGDKGPNTGGMGAYSPAPVVTGSVHERIMQEIILPTVKGMSSEGIPYTGFLYAGLMIAADGSPRVVEFNCRFGDPECQPVMLRLQNDLLDLCRAAVDGGLETRSAQFDPRAAVGVVMAAGGYPDDYEKGAVIDGLDTVENGEDCKVFHAGTRRLGEDTVTDGGRVLCVTALGKNVTQAQARAYEVVRQIHWEKAYFRKDIAYRAIERETD